MQWLWLIIFVGALLIEVITFGNLISVWFAMGALVAYFAYLLQLPEIVQFVVFLVVSIATLLAIRPLAANYFRGNVVATNADRIIGKQAVLIQPITGNSWGEVNMHGLKWSALEVNNRSLPEGTLVEVVAIEGAKLIVREIK